METSASFEARSAPSSYPTRQPVSLMSDIPENQSKSARVRALFFRPQRVPNPLPIWPRQSDVC